MSIRGKKIRHKVDKERKQSLSEDKGLTYWSNTHESCCNEVVSGLKKEIACEFFRYRSRVRFS